METVLAGDVGDRSCCNYAQSTLNQEAGEMKRRSPIAFFKTTRRLSPESFRPAAHPKSRLVLPMLFLAAPSSAGCNDAEITSVATQDEAVEIVTVLYDNGIDSYTREIGDE